MFHWFYKIFGRLESKNADFHWFSEVKKIERHAGFRSCLQTCCVFHWCFKAFEGKVIAADGNDDDDDDDDDGTKN